MKLYSLRWVTIFLALSCISGFSHSHNPKHYVLSSGSPGTPYFNTAHDLARYISNKCDSSTIIQAVNSKGSIDNLYKLKQGLTDFIIVQRDAAVRSYYNSNEPIKNIEVILPLFSEALQIFVKGEEGVISFQEFKKRIKSDSIDNPHLKRTFKGNNNIFTINRKEEVSISYNGNSSISNFFRGLPVNDDLEDLFSANKYTKVVWWVGFIILLLIASFQTYFF